MMNGTNFAPPPGLKGDEKANLVQMHSFLFRLTEQLNAALAQTDNAIQKAQTTATAAASKPAGGSDATEYKELKSLIIKTADTVRAEMVVLETKLDGKYIAVSDWGTYEENIQQNIETTAKGTVESYGYSAKITDVADSLNSFVTTSNGYIRRGIIWDKDGVTPIIGIAIGQEIQNAKKIVDGVETNEDEKAIVNGIEYDVFNKNTNMALYTADRLAFYQNGVEVAYFSQLTMQVTRVNVNDAITFQGAWELSKKYGFTLRWIGGNE
jgi:hypothetical protein